MSGKFDTNPTVTICENCVNPPNTCGCDSPEFIPVPLDEAHRMLSEIQAFEARQEVG